jgi:hypothetical protein
LGPENQFFFHLKHSFCHLLHPVAQGGHTTHLPLPQTTPLWLQHQTAKQDENSRICHITWIINAVKLFIIQCKTSAKFKLRQLTTYGVEGYCATDNMMYSHSSLLSSSEFLNPIQPCHIVCHNFCCEWNSAIFPDYKPANTATHTHTTEIYRVTGISCDQWRTEGHHFIC